MKFAFLLFLILAHIISFSQKHFLFQPVAPEQSGIRFINKLPVSEDNFFEYNYYGNSSGVGVGDFNNDGRTDIFFSANRASFAMYLNTGDFHFNDVTREAGVQGNGNWATGVSVVDINSDGLLDIYVSHSGFYNYADSAKLSNELFVNQGNDKNGVPHFKEMAKEYGLDLPGSQTTQVVFFDYDHDGDMDAFVLNHAKTRYIVLYDAAFFQKMPNKNFSNRLLRNDNGHFTDVTEGSGIIRSNINFGLGVVVSDINNDGWPDLYCSSDFEERDCLYLNQHNGTFKEVLTSGLGHISQFSMGVDIADINNDGLPDLMTADMKPQSNYRQKMINAQDNDDKFRSLTKLGFYAQYSRNMLQVNQGIDNNGVPHFSEAGQIAGVSATDWSWSPLFIDFDNDGWKDLVITCGFAVNDNMDAKNKYVYDKAIDPTLLLNSQFFQNQKGNGFTNNTHTWYDQKKPLMSYGAAYADFDNDGKVDLIIANLNEPPSLLRNTGAQGNYLTIQLKGKGKNNFALGAKVNITAGSQQQWQELQPVRGYQSSQDYILHFGVGANFSATIKINWPDGTVSILKDQSVNKLIVVDQQNSLPDEPEKKTKPVYKRVDIPDATNFVSKQNEHPDFKYQFTLPYKISDVGQVVSSGDINGDGFMDYFVGGEAGSEKFFLTGNQEGTFTKLDPGCFKNEDDNMASLLIDLDHDGKPDLVTISRKGRSIQPQVYDIDTGYAYRLYQNLGGGQFKEVDNVFPYYSPSRSIAAGDFDNDGDEDLFIGGYTTQMGFGHSAQSYLLRNDSKSGHFVFTNITNNIFPLADMGMITSAEWKDLNGDHYPELLIAGEWMNCRLYKNNQGKLTDISNQSGLGTKKGLWSLITSMDVNGDGFADIIVGNAGLNNMFSCDSLHPMKMQLVTFDGVPPSIPLMTCFYEDNKEYPMYFRDELLAAVQSLRKIFINYDSYGKTSFNEMVRLASAKVDTVISCNTLESGVFINNGHGHFNFNALPTAVQVSRLNTVAKTGKNELVAAGNFYGYRTQFGMADAMPLILLEKRPESWVGLQPSVTGLFSSGQVSKIFMYTFNGKERILVFRKNEIPQIFESDNP